MSIPTTPNSPKAVIMVGLRNLVANCGTFQAAIPVPDGDYVQAKESIFLRRLTPGKDVWPHAVCYTGEEMYTPRVTAIPRYSGYIRLGIQTPCDLAEDEQEIQIDNFFSGIMQDLSILTDYRFAAVNDATLRPNQIEWDMEPAISRTTHPFNYWAGTIKTSFV